MFRGVFIYLLKAKSTFYQNSLLPSEIYHNSVAIHYTISVDPRSEYNNRRTQVCCRYVQLRTTPMRNNTHTHTYIQNQWP